MQIATIAGNLGRDAELKQTSNGNDVLNFAVAVNEKRDGKDVTTWYDCAVWGKRGIALEKYLTKGTRVTIIGRLSVRAYQRKDGSPGATMQISASEVVLQGGGEQGGGSSSGSSSRQGETPTRFDGGGGGSFDDDSIPFGPIPGWV